MLASEFPHPSKASIGISRPPLKVLVHSGGKTLFRLIDDPRLQVSRSADAAPDIVVFPCSPDDKFHPDQIQLPTHVEQRMREGQVAVVFDGAAEGPLHEAQRSEKLHGVLERLGVPAARAAFVTQERGYEIDYRAYCASVGIEPMRVLHYDYWIAYFFHVAGAKGEKKFHRRYDSYRDRRSHRDKRFVSLNWTLRPTKALFLLSLIRDGLWDAGHISLGGLELVEQIKGRGLPHLHKGIRYLPGFRPLAKELLPLLPKLEPMGQIRLDGDGPRVEVDSALPAFNSSWFTVVTESEMRDRPSRITEKPFKALVNFHPLLMLGSPGALQMIRDLGFQTFDGILDESYDLEPDPLTRFRMVYEQIIRLCRLDEAQLAQMEAQLGPRLIENARWGFTGLPRKFREEIDPAFVDEIVRLSPAGAFADG